MAYVLQGKDNSSLRHQQDSINAATQAFSDNRDFAAATLSLQAMMASSPQQQKLKATAQMMANCPVQQRLNSHVYPQGSGTHVAQRRSIEQAGLPAELGLADTGDKAMTKGQHPVVAKVFDSAQWDTKGMDEASQTNAAESALVGRRIAKYGMMEPRIKNESAKNIFHRTESVEDNSNPQLDPFIHKIDSWYGPDEGRKILTTYVQHVSDLDGYVVRLETGNAVRPAAGDMVYGVPKRDSEYSHQHQPSSQSHRDDAEKDGPEGFDAITKIVGEGARFQCIADYPGSASDNTQFCVQVARDSFRIITWKQLIVAWKSDFGGRYGISTEELSDRLKLYPVGWKKKRKGQGVELALHNAAEIDDTAFMLDEKILFGTSLTKKLSDAEMRRSQQLAYEEFYGEHAVMPEGWEPYNEEDTVDYGYRDMLRNKRREEQ
ncbi:MAG: hypothetical protein CVV11_15955 [Gammaproteobacteria bacterium HGW-Gammaproteobacteria-15]|nr:MAG: hypothetical protein CVV11_15955 [Gammaproteobacteria bacterium HGW-Gammaproteobacteria-15]